MSSKGFEFSGFRSLPVEREFLPLADMKAGDGVLLQINLDLLTLEKIEDLETEFNRLMNESMGFAEALDAINDAIEAAAESEAPQPKQVKGKKMPVAGTKPDAIKKFEVPKIEIYAEQKARFRFHATALAGKPGNTDPYDRLIYDWSAVKNGKKIPISYEVFMQMPPHALLKMYYFCLGEANNPTTQEKKVSKDT